jgi:ADP-ribose pyrophosphatase
VSIAADRSAEARATGGFFDVRRLDLTLRYPDGTESASFPYDVGARRALDAVVIAAHFTATSHGRPVKYVFLRSAVRPPCALRSLPPEHDGSLWELPAGLIEPDENPAVAAARELEEELGFRMAADDFRPLGPWTFPAPGIIGERHIPFAVEVDASSRATPTEDGSALERAAEILALPLDEAIEHCRRGTIRDAKTELALRRLAEAV